MRPESETELAEMIRGTRGPLVVRGGGTRPVGQPVQGEVLETIGLCGISLYEPGALTLVAGAGTPVAEIEAALAVEGQRLAFEPMDHRVLLGTTGEPTIGGGAAVNASGPRRVQVGACRDHMLGVRFVDGTGAVVKNGGRVMKNVTGYDLVKLLAGSHGTLGVLSEVSLKVLPRPETVAVLTFAGLSPERSVAAMSRALGSPFEVTGAARGVDGLTHLRLEGFAASVSYRTGRIGALLAPFGEMAVEADAARGAALWAGIRDGADLAEARTVWRVSVKPGDAPGLLAALDGQFGVAGYRAQMDWGGGLLLIGVQTGEAAPEALHAAVQGYCSRAGGHATLIKGAEDLRAKVPVFQPVAAPLAAINVGLRAKFDPRGILNTGLMG